MTARRCLAVSILKEKDEGFIFLPEGDGGLDELIGSSLSMDALDPGLKAQGYVLKGQAKRRHRTFNRKRSTRR